MLIAGVHRKAAALATVSVALSIRQLPERSFKHNKKFVGRARDRLLHRCRFIGDRHRGKAMRPGLQHAPHVVGTRFIGVHIRDVNLNSGEPIFKAGKLRPQPGFKISYDGLVSIDAVIGINLQ